MRRIARTLAPDQDLRASQEVYHAAVAEYRRILEGLEAEADETVYSMAANLVVKHTEDLNRLLRHSHRADSDGEV